MHIPPTLWLVLFAIGFPYVMYKALREPAWAAAAGAYVYFAIPTTEFNAPGIPYQPMFFGLATLGAFRYYKLFARWGRDDIIDAGVAAGLEAIDSIREKMVEAMVLAGVQGKMQGEIRRVGVEVGEAGALDYVDRTAPAAITVAVNRAVQSTIHTAADLAEREALAIQVAQAGKTKGHLHQALNQRIPLVIQEALDTNIERNVRENVDRRIEDFAADPQNEETQKDRGPLGVPIPKGPLGGLLTNPGLWVHLAFMLLTYVGAKGALYDGNVAMGRYQTTVLLLIPLIGIASAVRNANHFRLFCLAWMFGVWHICMNGVWYWLQYGGRADNAGGQGGESNFLGAIIVCVAPAAFALALNLKEGKYRLIALFGAGCFVLGVLASGSRAGLLALFAGMGYWMMMTNRKTIAVGVIMLAASCFLVVAPDDFWVRMGTILGKRDQNPWVRNAVEPSKHERLVLWKLAIKIFKQHPVMGIGPMNYPRVSAEETNFVGAYSKQRGLQAHQTWLQLLAEYGIMGAFVWGGGFFFSIWCYRKARVRMSGYEGYEWFPALCLGFEAGSFSTAIVLSFNSFIWYDYLYWHLLFGPIALDIANSTADRLDWMKPGALDVARPPPRYGPPTREGLDIDDIDLADTSPLSSSSRV